MFHDRLLNLALYVFAVELFPTEIRGLGFGTSSLLGRIGLVVAPFINWLGIGSNESSTSSIARMMLYGAALILSALITFPLPETSGRPLPDTIDQLEYPHLYDEKRKRRRAPTITIDGQPLSDVHDDL